MNKISLITYLILIVCTPVLKHTTDQSTLEIDWSNWKLQTVSDGKVVFVDPSKFTSPYFYFQNNVYNMKTLYGWPTTQNAKYPRTELRELNNTKNAEWRLDTGMHVLEFEISILTKDKLIFSQIKSDPGPTGGPLKLWSLNGRIWAQQGPHSGKTFTMLENYNNQKLHFLIVATNNIVTVTLNKQTTIFFNSTQQNNYFKVGNYYHGNSSSTVLLHSLKITHTV
jgi:hypothetical protein